MGETEVSVGTIGIDIHRCVLCMLPVVEILVSWVDHRA